MKTLKRLFVIISLLCIAGVASAQDVIVKKDNTTILSKVIEVSSSEIKYKKWSNQDGPIYSISRSDIISINYQNGDVEKFENSSSNPIIIQQNNSSKNGYMERDGNGLELDGRELSDAEVRALVGEENYQTYLSARGQINGGRFFTATFIVSLIGTVGLAAMAGLNNDEDLLMLAYVTGAVADISLPLMCILKGVGKGRMNWVADDYNSKSRRNTYSYNLSPSLIKYKTPQLLTNYGLGLTLSVNF